MVDVNLNQIAKVKPSIMRTAKETYSSSCSVSFKEYALAFQKQHDEFVKQHKLKKINHFMKNRWFSK